MDCKPAVHVDSRGLGWAFKYPTDWVKEIFVTCQDNLLGTDPHFVGTARGNFQLRDDSPAYKLGFQRIPVEKIGLFNSPTRASWPVVHNAQPK